MRNLLIPVVLLSLGLACGSPKSGGASTSGSTGQGTASTGTTSSSTDSTGTASSGTASSGTGSSGSSGSTAGGGDCCQNIHSPQATVCWFSQPASDGGDTCACECVASPCDVQAQATGESLCGPSASGSSSSGSTASSTSGSGGSGSTGSSGSTGCSASLGPDGGCPFVPQQCCGPSCTCVTAHDCNGCPVPDCANAHCGP